MVASSKDVVILISSSVSLIVNFDSLVFVTKEEVRPVIKRKIRVGFNKVMIGGCHFR